MQVVQSMTEAAPARSGAEIDLARIGRAVWERRGPLLALTLLAAIVSFLVVNAIAPRYTGETRLLLVSGDSFFTRPAGEREAQSTTIDEQAVQSQVQFLTSRDVAREVIRRLKLVGDPEFDPLARGPGLPARLLAMLGFGKSADAAAPEDRVLETFYDRTLIFPIRSSRVIAIEFSSRDPDLAARGANTIAEVFLEFQARVKAEAARTAGAWLQSAIEPLRERVAEAEGKVEAFRAASGLLVGANNVTIAAQQLAELNTQLATARSAQAESQAKARAIRDMIRQGRTLEITDVANNELIRRLNEQRAALSAQIALESRTLLPQHPRVKDLNAQLADIDRQLRLAAEKTVRGLENDARVAASRVESIQATLDAQKTLVGGANESEVKLRALEREARAQREQLEAYLARYREAQARDVEKASPADARVISRAIVPATPSFPKKTPIVLITTLAVLTLATAWIVGRELIAGLAVPVAAPAAFVAAGLPAAALVPAIAETAPPAVVADPALTAAAPPPPPVFDKAAFAPLIARLRALKPGDRGLVVLATTGAEAETGAMFIAPFARTLASEAKVVAMDLDGARRPLTRAAGLGEASGASDLVRGQATFSDAIHRDAKSRLHVIPYGREAEVAPAADAGVIGVVIDALRQTYDVLLVYLPAVGADEAFAALASRLDIGLVIDEAQGDGDTLATLKRSGVPTVFEVSLKQA